MGRRSPAGKRNEQFNIRLPEDLIGHVDNGAMAGPDRAKRVVAGLLAFEWASDQLRAKLCEAATRVLRHEVSWAEARDQVERADVLQLGSVDKALRTLARTAASAQERSR